MTNDKLREAIELLEEALGHPAFDAVPSASAVRLVVEAARAALAASVEAEPMETIGAQLRELAKDMDNRHFSAWAIRLREIADQAEGV